MQKDTPPVVPVGITTQIGLAVSALSALIGAVIAISHGDISEASLLAFANAGVTLWFVLGGRYAQATKAMSPQPTPGNVTVTVPPGAPQDPQAVASRVAAWTVGEPRDEAEITSVSDDEITAGIEPADPSKIPADKGDQDAQRRAGIKDPS